VCKNGDLRDYAYIHRRTRKEEQMGQLSLLSVLAAALMLAGMPDRAEAAVYCKTVGVPKGCVVRPAAPAAAAVYCTRPGFPVGCVARPAAPAARAVVRPGRGVNAGGPVNRPGLR
jgi:hypothetical protein